MKEGNNSVILGKLSNHFKEKRYPKLIYAYKKFFSTLNKLITNDNIYDEIANHDLYIIKDKHSLENYERILREVKFNKFKFST